RSVGRSRVDLHFVLGTIDQRGCTPENLLPRGIVRTLECSGVAEEVESCKVRRRSPTRLCCHRWSVVRAGESRQSEVPRVGQVDVHATATGPDFGAAGASWLADIRD